MAYDPYLDRVHDHEQTARAWLEFQPLFAEQRVGHYPLFMLAHSVLGDSDVATDVPSHVLDAIIEGIYRVLPNRNKIGVERMENPFAMEFLTEHFQKCQMEVPTTNYPLNRILSKWVKANRLNHKLLTEMAILVWRYFEYNPDTWGEYAGTSEMWHRQLLLADRSTYLVYIAFTHELLLTYPNLIYLISDYQTLDQIQLEHSLWTDTFTAVWEWTINSYFPQASEIVCRHMDTLSLESDIIRNIIVTPDDISSAGVDLMELISSGHIGDVINCANIPPIMSSDIVETYPLYGKQYQKSFGRRLLTHHDQTELQVQSGKQGRTRVSGFPSALKCESDRHELYPSADDVYEQYRIRAVTQLLRPVRRHIDYVPWTVVNKGIESVSATTIDLSRAYADLQRSSSVSVSDTW